MSTEWLYFCYGYLPSLKKTVGERMDITLNRDYDCFSFANVI